MGLIDWIRQNHLWIWFFGSVCFLCIFAGMKRFRRSEGVSRFEVILYSLVWPGYVLLFLVLGSVLAISFVWIFGPDAYREWRDKRATRKIDSRAVGYRDSAV